MERQQENNYGQKVHSPPFPSLSLCWNLASHRHGHTTKNPNKFPCEMEYHSCPFFFSMPPPPTHVTNMPTKGEGGGGRRIVCCFIRCGTAPADRRSHMAPFVRMCVCVCDFGRLAYYSTFERGAVCSLFGLFLAAECFQNSGFAENTIRTKVNIRFKKIEVDTFFSLE